ncbi:MAG: response regulator transcription factor [Cyclobacteriaceae bacterium]|jgi:DNA-binding NarL/FixJ family response regulator|nr:response regulator transcription factor [Cyclobacteriaceae bacterium]
MPKRVLVCEDHTLVVDGLKLLLQQHGFVWAGHTATVPGLVALIAEAKPDIVLLDLNLKGDDSLPALAEARAKFPELLIFILTMYRDEFLIERVRTQGANGFLEKDIDNEELLRVLGRHRDEPFYLSATLSREQQQRQHYRDQFAGKMKLTKREMDVIPLLAHGKTTHEIAEALFLSPLTVDTHRKNIFRKLNIGNVVDLVNFAHENKLV